MIDGWHCLFLKLNKIDAYLSGQSRNDCASNFRSGWPLPELTSESTQRTTFQEPEPSIIFRKG
ncbi:hypothetical protein D0B32_32080 [Paraburkholderia sp. DHOC27]|nr:hypothetical protein D0B32_32080 [Paraburkholderia sp. DHOC27]